MKNIQSAERVSDNDLSDNYVFRRSLLAYHKAAETVSGNVLEIGTGSGYGISVISPKAATFITIDKTRPPADLAQYPNVEFHRRTVPPIYGIETNSMDYVITFQVIEHIKDDFGFIKEIYRVLRHGGKLIITTPNKRMSITRNPWHIREYTMSEFKNLIGSNFRSVEALGVFGNERVMEYYEKNRLSVSNITRFDILDLQHKLPRWCLKTPYDILNRINRRKLLNSDNSLVSGIKMDDYRIAAADDNCFDFFFVAEK